MTYDPYRQHGSIDVAQLRADAIKHYDRRKRAWGVTIAVLASVGLWAVIFGLACLAMA